MTAPAVAPVSVRVPERGTAVVEHEHWAALRKTPEFWRLVDDKIVTVEQQGRDSVRLRGGAHVGRAYVGDILLEVHEKVPGATAALMAAASPRLRTQQLDSPTSGLGSLVTVLVQGFVTAVRDYAGSGREWRYDEQDDIGSTIAGRLDIRRTIDLRARGQRHLAAFHRPTVSTVTPMHRVLLAALREVDVLAQLQTLRPVDLARARALAVIFEDCLDAEVIARSPVLQAEAARLAADAGPGTEDLLSLAALLLSHQSLQPNHPLGGRAPLAWFVNLETLFERVVLYSLKEAAGRSTSVSKGSRYDAAVFPDAGLLKADPDIVVGGNPAVVVGDVKYKTWEGTADAGDLYQLLVHACTFKAPEAYLIYPSDAFVEVDWGISALGCRTRLYAVDVLNVRRDVRRLPGMRDHVATLLSVAAIVA